MQPPTQPRAFRPKGSGKRAAILSHLHSHFEDPPRSVAAMFGVSLIYVRTLRTIVRKELLAAAAKPPDDPLTIAAAEAAAEATLGRPMSLDERRIFLSDLAKISDREEIKVQAMSSLNRLEGTIRVTDDLGPRDPMTAAEANARIRELIAARKDAYGSYARKKFTPPSSSA